MWHLPVEQKLFREVKLFLLLHFAQLADQLHRLRDHLHHLDVVVAYEQCQERGFAEFLVAVAEQLANEVPDEDLIEVRLYLGVSVGLEVGVVEVLSVFAAAGGVVALVGVFLEQGGDV